MPPKFSAPPKAKGKGVKVVQTVKKVKKVPQIFDEKTLLKDLIIHYAFSHNIVLIPEGQEVDKVDPKTLSSVRTLLVHAKFSNAVTLLKRPDIVAMLMEHLNSLAKQNKKMTMFHFTQTNVTLSSDALSDFLTRITDKSLKTSIEVLLHDSEDCFSCLSHQADSILECGHQICLNCVNNLPKKNCPFCAKHFDKYFNKFENKTEKKDDSTKWSFVVGKEIFGFFEKRLGALLGSTSKLSEKDLAEIKVLCNYNPELVLKFLESHKIPSEETKFALYGFLHLSLMKSPSKIVKNTVTEKAFLKLGKIWMTTPNRMLRFLAVLETGTPDLDGKIMTDLNKTMTKWLVSIIASWKYDATLCEQFNQHIQIWKKLFQSMHAGSYKKYPEFIDIVESVRGKKPFTIHSKYFYIDKYFKDLNHEDLLEIFVQNPGVAFRNLNRFCYAFPDLKSEVVVPYIDKCLNTMKLEQLIELHHVMGDYPKCECKIHNSCVSYVTKNGTLQFISPREPQPRNSQHVLIRSMVTKLIQSRLESNRIKEIDVAVISTETKKNRIKKGKQQEMAKFTTSQPSGRGDVIDVSELASQSEVILYDYWEHSAQIFLDLTMFALDDQFKCPTTGKNESISDFGHQKAFGGALVHSGDVTENGKLLTAQYLRINLGQLRTKFPKVRYLVLAVLSFSDVAYDELAVANVGIGYRKGTVKGSGPYGSTVVSACNLRGKSKMNLSAILDVHTGLLTFMNMNVAPKGKGTLTVSGHFSYLAELTGHFMNWIKTPSSPMNWFDIGMMICASYDKVVVQDGQNVQCFVRIKDETSEDFLKRIQSGKSYHVKEILSVFNGNKVDFEEGKKWLYFGNADFSKLILPKKSYVVSSSKVEGDNSLVSLDDPFKILYQKSEKKEK